MTLAVIVPGHDSHTQLRISSLDSHVTCLQCQQIMQLHTGKKQPSAALATGEVVEGLMGCTICIYNATATEYCYGYIAVAIIP